MINCKFIKKGFVILLAVLLVAGPVFAIRTSAADDSEEEAATVETAETETETDDETIDLTDAAVFTFSDEGIFAEEGAYSGYEIDGTALTIKESGIYVLAGSCGNGTVVVKKNVTGVTLVLDGLELSASATAPLTFNKGSGVTIFVMEDTENSLSDDEYNNDDVYTDEDLYPDIENAVIKCKDGSQVTICGTGTLTITANGKNGIKGGADLYKEDEKGNAEETLLSAASLTIQEVALNITADVNDALKSDQVLNILSGTITISAADDGIKSDYVLNIGAEGMKGPEIEVTKAKEGIEAAELNVWSGSIMVNATDDGINAANSDLENYSFSYNQYGGYVYVNVSQGDGIDSNGTIVLEGGTLEVYSPSMGDGDPLDSEFGTSLNGATVLAVGHLGMPQGYSAETPYVVFGDSMGGFDQMPGFRGNDDFGQNGRNGRGGFDWNGGTAQTSLITAGSTISIVDEDGEVLYTAEAVRDASYVLFSDPALIEGSTYTLMADDEAVAEAEAGTVSTGGMGGWGQMPGGGQFPGNGGFQMPEDGGWSDIFGEFDWSDLFGDGGWPDLFGNGDWPEMFGNGGWPEMFEEFDWSDLFGDDEWEQIPWNGGNSGRPGNGGDSGRPGNGGNAPEIPDDGGSAPGTPGDGGWL